MTIKGFPLLVDTSSSEDEVGNEVEDEVASLVTFREEKLARRRERKEGKGRSEMREGGLR